MSVKKKKKGKKGNEMLVTMRMAAVLFWIAAVLEC
tara:strand:- start:368 stop:472 length:105 start_codon:yes stop_codon:yes gene_type:complete